MLSTTRSLCNDIIVLTETWLNNSFNDHEILPNDFHVYRRDRYSDRTGRGGGVLIAVRTTLDSCLVDVPNCNNTEFICVRLAIGRRCVYIMGVYLPPAIAGVQRNEYNLGVLGLVEFVSERLTPNDDLIVLGDFNLSDLKWARSEEDVLTASNVHAEYEQTIVDGLTALGLM